MSFQAPHGHSVALDKERVKRAREEYQILLCGEPHAKSQRTCGDCVNTGASSCSAELDAAGDDFESISAVGPSPLSGSCTVFPRPSMVEVTRADSGKTFAFVFSPSVTYRWDRRGAFYRCLTGERVGYELQETVRASVSRHVLRPAMAHGTSTHSPRAVGGSCTCRGCSSSGNEECDDDSRLTHPTGGGEDAAPYYYELSQVSRALQPPPLLSSFNNVRDGELVWYSHSTPSLVVDCLLRCAAEEAQLLDTLAWALLYKGRHLHTEAGKDMLGRDLLRRAAASDHGQGITAFLGAGDDANPTITLCAVRKF